MLKEHLDDWGGMEIDRGWTRLQVSAGARQAVSRFASAPHNFWLVGHCSVVGRIHGRLRLKEANFSGDSDHRDAHLQFLSKRKVLKPMALDLRWANKGQVFNRAQAW